MDGAYTEVQEPAAKEVSVQLRMQAEILWAKAGTRAAATMATATATASLNMIDRVNVVGSKTRGEPCQSGISCINIFKVCTKQTTESRGFSAGCGGTRCLRHSPIIDPATTTLSKRTTTGSF
jgi:hypothetical protein